MNEIQCSEITLVITTYQSPDRLRWVLESACWQTEMPKEVIVADDGSDLRTRELVREYQERKVLPIVHSWQPDHGFRLSRSRNLAASRASGSWLIFLDGDCVMPPQFISTQAKLAGQGCLVFGSRKLLAATETANLLEGAPSLGAISHLIKGRKFWKVPFGIFRKFPYRSWRHARGFHLAMETEVFRSLIGFDEAYQSWGLEDSDFLVRASRLGIILKDGRYATSLLHLYHAEVAKDALSFNEPRFLGCLGDSTHIHAKSSILAES